MALENFNVNTLIIPMDVAYQNNGMYRAYGLVYKLLSNGIPVKWAIQSGKPFNGTDFVASAQDIQTLAPIVNHAYSGGPFIVDSAYYAAALPIITAWQLANPNVKVHRATAPFSADIAATMTSPPRIAVEDKNSGIIINYLNVAGIPDSNGNTWTSTSPDVLSETEIAQGALFGFDLEQCRRIAYDIFLSPHTGTDTWDDPNLKVELNDYLYQGGYLHATCESVPSIENTAGPFLTLAGIPTNDINKGDKSTFTVDVPDFPSAQAVSTGLVQDLPGGAFQTVYHLSPGLVYNPQTQIIAHFIETKTGKQYDFMMAGPYKNGAGAGKIMYEGGHNYDPKLPYTSNMENLYYRFVLDSVFFSVSKPLMFLEFSTGNPNNVLFQNTVNTITFSVVNTGASPATNTGFSVTLIPGMIYNNDATIPPTSIVGQTLTWSSAALGNVPPGTVLTFTADYSPPVPVLGEIKLADFTASFGDEFNETYSFSHCIKGVVEILERADLLVEKAVDKEFATYGDTLTYTITITNTGTRPAINVVFLDPIPADSTFVPNSVTVNGIPVPGADPGTGFSLPDIPPAPAPGSTVVVTFQITVNDMETPADIVNRAEVGYQFIYDSTVFDATSLSNVVVTHIRIGQITLLKSTDTTVAAVGDIITYTTEVINTGNVTDFNTIFFDNPPAGTNFIPGTVFVNGVNQPGASPIAGIPLGDLPVSTPDAPNVTTVSFQVVVTSIPAPPTAINTANATFLWRINPADQPNIPGFGISNPVITQLVTPQLTVVKSANRTAVDLGETVTYTVTVINTGDVTANSVILTDLVPAGMTFIPGSATVGGFPAPAADPNAGIPLGDIAPGGSVTVTFQATATSMPVPNPTTNIATAAGLFMIEPTEPPRQLVFDSNPWDVLIENATLTPTKSVDKAFAEVGDVLTYTVVVNNTGTVPATNVVFTDNPPDGTAFIPGSVTVAGAPVPGDPSAGIPLPDIPPGGSVTVTFQVTVDAIPVPNPAVNIGTIDADFIIDQTVIHKTFDTNPVETKVEVAELDVMKAVDKAFVEVGDIITYTITITNIGTVPANNVIFTDVPPNGTSFVPSSVTINGVPDGIANPALGINLGTIPAGGSVIVSFKVKADFVPVPNPTTNIALAEADFPVDPNNPVTKDFESNPVDTTIEIARLDMTKSVDKAIVEVGDIATYTVVIVNTGTVPANNVIFTDTPPAGTTFVPGSVTVNGIPNLLANPSTGFNIGTIPAGGFTTVTFKVTVDTIPVPNPTINIAAATGTFPVNPNNPITKDFESNPVPLQVELAQLEVLKSVDKPFAEIGENVTYTVIIKNTGTVPANNVVFTDNPPAGTTFVSGSVAVNGVPVPGNPAAGINIGSIIAGGTVTVTFRVTVTSVPTPNPSINIAVVDALFPVNPALPPVEKEFPSNPVEQNIINAQVSVVKSVDKTGAIVGDTLNYTVTVKNTGNVDVDAVMYDLVPASTEFVTDSLTIDGVPVPGANPNNGVALGVLTPGQSMTITFKVTVVSVPEPPLAINMAAVEFQYIVNPAEPPRSKTHDSNEVETRIEEVGLELVKTADKDRVVQGDILTYTIAVKNTGNILINNVIFTDPIPVGTSFIEGSFILDGIPVPGANPGEGVNIGTISPDQTVIVKFSVRYDFLPCPPIIRNIAFARFNYRIAASGPILTGEAESNMTETEASQTNFKQLSVEEIVCIPRQKPDAEEIVNIIAEVEIISTRVIKTTKGVSQEGQVLTGYKLLIEGMLHQKIEYIADEPAQSAHTAEFDFPFSSFIILPENFREGSLGNVNAYVEDKYVKLISPRCMFKNVTLRLEAEIIC